MKTFDFMFDVVCMVLMFVIVVIVFVVLPTGVITRIMKTHDESDHYEQCKNAGGVYINSRSGEYCLNKNAIIN